MQWTELNDLKTIAIDLKGVSDEAYDLWNRGKASKSLYIALRALSAEVSRAVTGIEERLEEKKIME